MAVIKHSLECLYIGLYVVAYYSVSGEQEELDIRIRETITVHSSQSLHVYIPDYIILQVCMWIFVIAHAC